ncbi:hypothetical protein VTI28DRAFT_9374 [Corynascus sepedonium]
MTFTRQLAPVFFGLFFFLRQCVPSKHRRALTLPEILAAASNTHRVPPLPSCRPSRDMQTRERLCLASPESQRRPIFSLTWVPCLPADITRSPSLTNQIHHRTQNILTSTNHAKLGFLGCSSRWVTHHTRAETTNPVLCPALGTVDPQQRLPEVSETVRGLYRAEATYIPRIDTYAFRGNPMM